MIVEPESDASRHAPSEPPSRERIAFERVERAVVPRQDVAPELRTAADDIRHQLVQARRRLGRIRPCRIRHQVGMSRNIPTQAEHALAGVQQRPSGQAKVICRVLDAVEALSALHAPAISARLNDQSAGLVRRKAWLIAMAIVSGTRTNSAAPSSLSADGSRSRPES